MLTSAGRLSSDATDGRCGNSTRTPAAPSDATAIPRAGEIGHSHDGGSASAAAAVQNATVRSPPRDTATAPCTRIATPSTNGNANCTRRRSDINRPSAPAATNAATAVGEHADRPAPQRGAEFARHGNRKQAVKQQCRQPSARNPSRGRSRIADAAAANPA